MTTSNQKQHRATPRQWDAVASAADAYSGSWGDCLLELRSRVEALEIQNALNAANSQSSPNDRQIRRSASAGSLVGRVADTIIDAFAAYVTAEESAHAAILAVAEWLIQQKPGPIWVADIETIADLLEKEANR